MASVGSGDAGKTYIGAGNGKSGRYASIGTDSGLTAHGIVIAQGTNPFTTSSILGNGQLLIGSNGADPVVAGLTAGSGIIISTGPGSINIAVNGSAVGETITGATGGALSPTVGNWNILATTAAAGTTPITTAGSGSTLTIKSQISQAIASTDVTKIGLCNFDSSQFSVDANGFVTATFSGFTWNDVSGAFSPLKNNGYFITATATGTLPASPSQGDTIKFFVDHASQVLTIQASGTQIIRMASAVTAAGGTAVSTAQGDSVELVYRASDTCWCAVAGFSGIWSLT